MSIAGHVSRAVLSRYSHVRMEAKTPGARRNCGAPKQAADKKRGKEAEQRREA